MMHTGSERHGLALSKLLIAIALIAVLIGLLLPGVQELREMSNRLTCANYLKEIGLGFHRFHDVHGYLPDGGKNQCDKPFHPLMPPELRHQCEAASPNGVVNQNRFCPYQPEGPVDVRSSEWSWPYQILAFVGQPELHSNPDDAVIVRTPLALYHCPSRRPHQFYAGHNTIDYGGSAGSTGRDAMIVQQGLEPISLLNIVDGALNTVMAGEKRLKLDRLGVTYDDNESWANPGWDSEIFRCAFSAPDRPNGDLEPSPDIRETDPGLFP